MKKSWSNKNLKMKERKKKKRRMKKKKNENKRKSLKKNVSLQFLQLKNLVESKRRRKD